MNSRNPEAWVAPAKWAPLDDGEWEIEQLRSFAIALLERAPRHGVVLDAFEDGYVKVDVFLDALKIGEVFVNRDATERELAVYRLFVGHDGHEQDVHSVEEAVDGILAAEGVWRDYPGTTD